MSCSNKLIELFPWISLGARGQEARKEDELVVAGSARRGQFTDLHFISEVPVIPSSYELSDRIKKREDK